jgi:acyl-CoA thioester hydrolase
MTDRTRTGTTTIRVRYAECDAMGVAHHTAYSVWFEIGRTELLREVGGSYRELEAQGILLAVTDLCITYHRPARYDDEVELTTTWIDAGRVKIKHEYELRCQGERLATGRTTLACLDATGRPRALPESLTSVG